MWIQECPFDPPHTHEFPDDWEFGGAASTDPRADRRWKPTTYVYLDERLQPVWVTQTPLCDDEALDEFTKHAALGAKYLQVARHDSELVLLDFEYDAATDTVSDL